MFRPELPRRVRFALVHFLISAAILGLVLLVIVLVWYPPPLTQLQGLTAILLLLCIVDLCLGPMATLIVAGPKKPLLELRRDLTVIAAVQVAALFYGLWAVFVARPAFIVFNADRFDIVVAADVEPLYRGAPIAGEFAQPSLTGPRWVFARQPSSIEERNDILFSAATGGADIKNYPNLYSAWPGDETVVRTRVKSATELAQRSDVYKRAIERAAQRAGIAVDEIVWLPVVGRRADGVALLRKSDLTSVALLNLAP
jgi:hypothetical protein